MKILFHTPLIDIRGTCVSLYDYAHYHEILLGGHSVILTAKNVKHDSTAIYKFAKRFEILYYDSVDQIDDIAKDFDLFYTIKYGKKDDIICKTVKTAVHCVFDLSEPHGDVYAAVSDTLAKKFGRTTFVPHMIGLKPSRTGDNLRKKLGIPENAVVFGRHGGKDTFDLSMAKTAIVHAVCDRPDLHFVFVNTPLFYGHPRIHHIDKIVDLDEKNRFIMTCDAMIHAQSLGETFGISIGEFSVNNKPIIAYKGKVWNDHYKTILKDRALWYLTEDECYNTLVTFFPEKYEGRDLNCYKQYSPKIVMQQFKKVFMDLV
jgi:hypothetical protein